MKTIMTLVLGLVCGFGGMTVFADEAPTTPAPSTPVASTPAPVSTPSIADIPVVKAGMEAAAKDYAAKVEAGIAAATTPSAPKRTWTQAAGDGLGALVDGGRYVVCQAGRGVMNVDGAASALVRIPTQYVEEVAFSAATTCNAASR